ncbi:MAG: phage head morphogenesis protein [Bacteroidales bacterium]|nr:phage head morphogenesis protein [Bacteroidales bacterium]
MNFNYYGTRDVTDAVGSSVSFDEGMLSEVLREIYEEEVKPQNGDIPSELYEATRGIFEKATAQGMAQSRNKRIATEEDFLRRYTHSIDVFSAFRVHKYASLMADMLHDADGNLRTFEEWRNATASIQSHFNRNWLETEYNTAILRAEQAADWKMFEADKDVMPNLKWMPTSSATPREEHAVFWREELTLPVDDPFWDAHRPGDLWNCKCYLQQTDAPATAKGDIPKGKDVPKPADGLKTNPGKAAEMFDRSHSYYPDPKVCLWLRLAKQAKESGAEAKSSRVVDAVKCVQDCHLCKLVKCEVRKDNKRNSVMKKLEQSIKPLVDNKVKVKKALEDSAHTISVGFSKWANKHLVADAMQTKHSVVFKESDLKNLKELLAKSEYVKSAIPEEPHSHCITKFYYFKVELHGSVVYLNVGEVRDSDKRGKTTTHRYLYSVTDELFHKEKA